MAEFHSRWLHDEGSDVANYGSAKSATSPSVTFGAPIVDSVEKNPSVGEPAVCSICETALRPTVAAYGLGRCSVHMSEAEFFGWLRFHREHWREYIYAKGVER